MRPPPWRVGELARQTGLSVRTLHYYDEIGLLAPSFHTGAGHRLYTARDVARLQQIKSLRQLGFALEEVRDCLGRPDFSPLRVIDMHLARLREQIELQQRLCGRLEAIAAHLRSAEEVSVEAFLQTIEGMTMVEKYYTPEQLEEFQERARQFGEERIRQAEADWQELIAQVRAEMDRGTDPASETVQALARRWTALVDAFTGGNPEIHKALQQMWTQEQTIHGMDTAEMRKLREYVYRGTAPQQPE
jgi:MerR family transcriptional regulator, thiopeptide resistance regulator